MPALGVGVDARLGAIPNAVEMVHKAKAGGNQPALNEADEIRRFAQGQTVFLEFNRQFLKGQGRLLMRYGRVLERNGGGFELCHGKRKRFA